MSVSFFAKLLQVCRRVTFVALGAFFMGIPTRDILPPSVQHVRIQSCALDWQGQKWQHTHTAKSSLCALWFMLGADPLAHTSRWFLEVQILMCPDGGSGAELVGNVVHLDGRLYVPHSWPNFSLIVILFSVYCIDQSEGFPRTRILSGGGPGGLQK